MFDAAADKCFNVLSTDDWLIDLSFRGDFFLFSVTGRSFSICPDAVVVVEYAAVELLKTSLALVRRSRRGVREVATDEESTAESNDFTS